MKCQDLIKKKQIMRNRWQGAAVLDVVRVDLEVCVKTGEWAAEVDRIVLGMIDNSRVV